MHHKVKKIAIGTFNVSPKSACKEAGIDIIIENIHLLRSKFSNEIHFLLGGDLNRLKMELILDSYGALKQLGLEKEQPLQIYRSSQLLPP